jgi:hypothetical protein
MVFCFSAQFSNQLQFETKDYKAIVLPTQTVIVVGDHTEMVA